jgi:hypothetical protein
MTIETTSLAGTAPREPQCADAVLMIRPARFGTNAETLGSNHFQEIHDSNTAAAVAANAARELDELAVALAAAGVHVHAFAGQRDSPSPDEVFPNNWVSFHADGTVVLYPLLAPSRRRERRPELLDELRRRNYRVSRVIDLSLLEQQGLFLEGTGSLVLDRTNRVAYACRSPRTSAEALSEFGRSLGYETMLFDAVDGNGRAIYHTNVLLSVGSGFAVLCAAAVRDGAQRRAIVRRLEASGRELLEITFEQLQAFAGNLLELRALDSPVIALSKTALGSLDPGQQRTLERHGGLVAADVGTIERYGGGSVRCMLAEIFLPLSTER